MSKAKMSLVATAGGQQFYAALKKQAQDAVASFYTAQLYPIQYPQQGDFLWNFQNVNQVFNQGTFDYISARVSPGDIDETAQLTASGGFPNAYVQVISKIAYALSSDDQANVNKAELAASIQAQTIVSDYQTTFGQIAPSDLTTAQQAVGQFAVKTLQDYVISYVLGYLWSGSQTNKQPPLSYQTMAGARNLQKLLPFMPASGNQVVADVSLYLSKLTTVNTILSNQQQGSWILAQLQGNTSSPTSSNGGMSTVDPNNGGILPALQVKYGMGSASTASISNDLNNTGRTISLQMQTSASSNNQISVSIEGQTGFSVGEFLRFTTSAGATYDMSKASGTSESASVTMHWQGYSMVPISPTAWQQATDNGWFFTDPIAQAVATGTQDITAFKFVAPVGYNLASFEAGGNFGILNNLLIANYPTISITYTKADYHSFVEKWSENVSGNLSLFGFISLGHFSQGAYGSKVVQGSDNSTFTVTFSASPQIVSVPQLLQQAFVIGGSVTNPGVAT